MHSNRKDGKASTAQSSVLASLIRQLDRHLSRRCPVHVQEGPASRDRKARGEREGIGEIRLGEALGRVRHGEWWLCMLRMEQELDRLPAPIMVEAPAYCAPIRSWAGIHTPRAPPPYPRG